MPQTVNNQHDYADSIGLIEGKLLPVSGVDSTIRGMSNQKFVAGIIERHEY
jgi:hypothetical protein